MSVRVLLASSADVQMLYGGFIIDRALPLSNTGLKGGDGTHDDFTMRAGAQQHEGGGRAMMKKQRAEEEGKKEKEEPWSLKGHWPFSRFPALKVRQLCPSRLDLKPSLIWVELLHGAGLLSRNSSHSSATSLPAQRREGKRSQSSHPPPPDTRFPSSQQSGCVGRLRRRSRC